MSTISEFGGSVIGKLTLREKTFKMCVISDSGNAEIILLEIILRNEMIINTCELYFFNDFI